MSDSADHIEAQAPPWPGYPKIPPIIADQFKDVADPDPVDIAAAYQAAVSALPYVESWKAKPDHEFSGFSAKKYSDPSSWETLRTGYNKGRARFGLPPISQEDFERIWTPLAEWGSLTFDQQDAIQKESERRAKKDAIKKYLGDARSTTPTTADMIRVSAVLEVGSDRAYKILRVGTAIFEQRKALAEAFHDDPARNFPAAWGTRNSWGGHRVGTLPPTFGDYVMDHADRFEYGDTFGTLERAFLRGTLPHHYPTLGALVDKLIADSVDGVDLGQVADLWAAFEGWRTQVTATT